MRNVSKRIKSWNIPVWHASFHLLPAHSSLDPFPTLSPLLLYLYHFNHLAMCLVPLTSPAARSTSRNTNTHAHRGWISNTHADATDFCPLSAHHTPACQSLHFEALCNLDSFKPCTHMLHCTHTSPAGLLISHTQPLTIHHHHHRHHHASPVDSVMQQPSGAN